MEEKWVIRIENNNVNQYFMIYFQNVKYTATIQSTFPLHSGGLQCVGPLLVLCQKYIIPGFPHTCGFPLLCLTDWGADGG